MSNPSKRSSKFNLNIIWGALLFSMFLYLVITINYTKNPHDELESEKVLNFISAVAIAMTFISQFLFLKAKKIIKQANGLKNAFPMLIATWALGEAIAIFGVVLAFYGIEASKVYSFFAAAIFLHLIRHPFRFQDI